ncbi:hypothetical protein OHB41_45280 [Streptomyces sp. NBC_01571]|nr:hypothetical protein [Streptomyces sp. NBC_01571]MCX4580255.1 hypothetical protein [Streptomyces sp. NBC_01571]
MTPTSTSVADQCNNLALRKAARYLGATYDKALAPSVSGARSSASCRG